MESSYIDLNNSVLVGSVSDNTKKMKTNVCQYSSWSKYKYKQGLFKRAWRFGRPCLVKFRLGDGQWAKPPEVEDILAFRMPLSN